MTFEEHLEATRDDRGVLHLDIAEIARADEIASELAANASVRVQVAKKAAAAERNVFLKHEKQGLTKVMTMTPLSLELMEVLDTKVPLGESRVVDYGDLNDVRIRERKDVVEKNIREVARAYVRAMDHLDESQRGLEPAETIREALTRLYGGGD